MASSSESLCLSCSSPLHFFSVNQYDLKTKREKRGNRTCVVRVLWSMKKIRPSVWTRSSQPSDKNKRPISSVAESNQVINQIKSSVTNQLGKEIPNFYPI
jgi:ribosomal protein L34E